MKTFEEWFNQEKEKLALELSMPIGKLKVMFADNLSVGKDWAEDAWNSRQEEVTSLQNLANRTWNQLVETRRKLYKLQEAVSKLPFGESPALPWCRESFPELDQIMNELEKEQEK